MKTLFSVMLLVVGLIVVDYCHAQDSHYWRMQYGPRSALLGGAVIGSVSDISATFYNPGGLATADSLSFAIAAQVRDNEKITLIDGAGEGIDLSTSRTGVVPSILAGQLSELAEESRRGGG